MPYITVGKENSKDIEIYFCRPKDQPCAHGSVRKKIRAGTAQLEQFVEHLICCPGGGDAEGPEYLQQRRR